MTTKPLETGKHCAYCGHGLSDEERAPERFGELFCSEAHAEEFVTGVRAARMDAAARAELPQAHSNASPSAGCSTSAAAQRTWGDYLKRAACWGAPLLLLLAIPLIWSSGWAATGGSLLGVLALLACPPGMYFMMRGMMNMEHHGAPDRGKEDRRA